MTKRLQKEFQELGFKCNLKPSPGPGDKVKLMEWITDNIVNKFQGESNTIDIYDRFTCIDQQIYGPICRNDYDLDDYKLWTEIMNECVPVSCKPYFIYCRPAVEDIIGFEDGRDQMEGVIENAEALLRRYDDMYFHLSTKYTNWTLLYNYKYNDPLMIVEEYMNLRKSIETGLTNQIDEPVSLAVIKGLDSMIAKVSHTDLIQELKNRLILRSLTMDLRYSMILNENFDLDANRQLADTVIESKVQLDLQVQELLCEYLAQLAK